MTTLPFYPPPLDKLLSLGKPEPEELDYRALGIGSEHIPDLIRMVGDETWHELDSEHLAVYTDMHAWFALGQLRAAEAVEPLLEALERDREEGGDWASEKLPMVFDNIGPAALPALQRFLSDATKERYTR